MENPKFDYYVEVANQLAKSLNDLDCNYSFSVETYVENVPEMPNPDYNPDGEDFFVNEPTIPAHTVNHVVLKAYEFSNNLLNDFGLTTMRGDWLSVDNGVININGLKVDTYNLYVTVLNLLGFITPYQLTKNAKDIDNCLLYPKFKKKLKYCLDQRETLLKMKMVKENKYNQFLYETSVNLAM